MRDRPSFTAAWVAAWRGLGAPLLGDDALADDPFGVPLAGAWARGLAGAGRTLLRNRTALHWLGYMQVRTHAIDRALLAFVDEHPGAQVVILGAGHDARAARFADRLAGARVFEVDHPATQARKRAVLARLGAAPPTRYLSWDFEAQPLDALPGALAALGFTPGAPTLVVWEGVTMYLSPAAIEASFAALRAIATHLVFTYVERDRLDRPRGRTRLLTAFLGAIGEPYRWGWHPDQLPAWLAARGFTLRDDDGDADLASAWLPPWIAAHVRREGRHVARADRA